MSALNFKDRFESFISVKSADVPNIDKEMREKPSTVCKITNRQKLVQSQKQINLKSK
jgi:hypothetical protein